MRWFHAWETMEWGRIAAIVAFATAFWIGLAAVMPERWHKVGTVILGALQSAITLTMRSGRSRAEKIEEKVEELETKKAETRVEVAELISNEAKEKAEQREEKKP